ncbi:matrix metalloproteinase-28 isoform X2 [Pipistrellus kuhlii]|uniref:matrix metalloproteinase-28 isoform X2 n=1 Tax=Pipistrellus kuhlii TaxID=59472 RepID=UPI00174F5B1E|nr:matrix metalloproteinase-28 isoform X2 [Pipistrellus kuhlii]
MAARAGLLLRALPLLLWGGLGARPPGRAGRELRREAEAFLERYGYLSEQAPGAPSSTRLSNAIREFQWVSQLPISGVLDPATLHQMTLPRCGVADTDGQAARTEQVSALFAGRRAKMRRKKRFAKQGNKWYKQHLSYRLVNWPQHLPEPAVRGAVRAAFQLWSNVSALEFWEAPATGPADIRLTFYQGDHNDGLSNAFDGPGGALAHAFLPRRGEAHFDRDERWSLSRRRGRNLFVVLAHEIGHTLGLAHSPAPRALMAPYYKRLGRDALLSWDDVLAVQSLYGKPQGGSVATQLPGKLFTDFEAWDPHRSQGRRSETQGPKYCHSPFDAITVDRQQRLYVFQGSHFWEVGADGNVSGPHPLQERWAGLPPNIEAAAVSLENGDFFFFKGGPLLCAGPRGAAGGALLPPRPAGLGRRPRRGQRGPAPAGRLRRLLQGRPLLAPGPAHTAGDRLGPLGGGAALDGLLARELGGCPVLKAPPPHGELQVLSWPAPGAEPVSDASRRPSLQKAQRRSWSASAPRRTRHSLSWRCSQNVEVGPGSIPGEARKGPRGHSLFHKDFLPWGAGILLFLLTARLLPPRQRHWAARQAAGLRREAGTTLQDCVPSPEDLLAQFLEDGVLFNRGLPAESLDGPGTRDSGPEALSGVSTGSRREMDAAQLSGGGWIKRCPRWWAWRRQSAFCGRASREGGGHGFW